MWKRVSLLIVIFILACSPAIRMDYTHRVQLLHTYSVCIVPDNDTASINFARTFKEELIWEQYLYVADNCSDADTVVWLRVKQNKNVVEANFTFKEKATGNIYKEKVRIEGATLKFAAKLTAHHLWSMVELPPDVNAALTPGDVGDPSTDGIR